MSAAQGQRGGRGRGRGSASSTQRSSRGGSLAKPGARTSDSSVAPLNGSSVKPYKPSPAQNGFGNAIRRPSPSPVREPRGASPPRNVRTSTSPPRLGARPNVGTKGRGGTDQRRMDDVYQKLKKSRDQERKNAIKSGALADPDKPTVLAKAITPVGTCQDMCPRFERVERIVQLMVDGCEKKTSSSGDKEPCEEKMVKRFRRSAAGYDEQLPSDIRPPLVLQKTLDYLIDEIVGGSQSLATVHKFVWDRTRGIRNDFSIQQVTKVEDLRIAISCFERIARFHILSLHQLSRPDHDNGGFDHHQEREQLNNTLLSLMYYYDDSRHKLSSPNEAEFRAYCIVFEIQDQRPDLEDRAQQWPRPLLQNRGVQTAFKLYAAAGNTSDEQGPLRPRASFAVAQANTGRFWDIIQSSAVSYTLACVAEIYFNLVRRMTLEAVWKAYKGKRAGPTKMEDWVLVDLTLALGFDSEDQTQSYVEEHGFSVAENDNGQSYIDLGSVSRRYLTDTNPRRKQVFSKTFVEAKRLGRTLPAVINGFSASQARNRGLVEDASESEDSPLPNGSSLFLSRESNGELDTVRKSRSSHEDRASRSSDISPSLTHKTIPNPSVASAAPQPTTAPAASISPIGKPNPSTTKSISAIFGVPDTTNASKISSSSFGKPTFPNPFSAPLPNVGSSPITDIHANPSPPTREPFTTSSNPSSNASSSFLGRDPLESVSLSAATKQHSPFQPQLNPNAAKDDMRKSTKPSSPFKAFSSAPSGPGFTPTTLANMPEYRAETAPTLEMKINNSRTDQSRVATANSPKIASVTTSSQTLDAAQRTLLPTTKPLPGLSFSPASSKPSSSLSGSQITQPQQPPRPSDGQSSAPQDVSLRKQCFPSVEPALSGKKNSSSLAFSSAPSSLKTITETPDIQVDNWLTASHNTTQIPCPQSPSKQDLPTSSAKLTVNSASNSEPQKAVNPSRPFVAQGKGYTSELAPSLISYPPSRTERHDIRPPAINALSDAVMLDDKGLLQQFIEYTIGPIVATSIRQIEDERSWQQARQYRICLLSKKYLDIWKKTAWRLGLLRKGKERRRNFAESMRKLAQNTRGQENTDSILEPGSKNRNAGAGPAMPAPAKSSEKRKSLPITIARDSRLSSKASNKRKRDLQSPHMHHSLPDDQSSRKRSRTIPAVSKSSPINGTEQEGHNRSPAHLLFAGRTDTTQTDYFRLKAMGLDPNTPTVPWTRRKRRREEDVMGGKTPSKKSPCQDSTEAESGESTVTQRGALHDMQTAQGVHSTPGIGDDPDEALFARLRKVREAMSDSISWFQSERAQSERTSSSSVEALLTETPAQKRLREIRTTPSRTEQRLRNTGAHGLLPKAWASNPSWRDADGRISTSVTPASDTIALPAPRRPEAVGHSSVTGCGWGNGKTGLQGSQKTTAGWPGGAGSSVEDAIEL